ncbi:DUF2231 domain-containing protein [Aquipuribacter sp. SD81]|uniref:DUF2231 domain-containing protein n=1 Tax=Aquipuribacter sp. SD81 TaxID=3127703 RepID=UPI00301A391D
MFEQIGGLPLHPLVVHAVVVLLPLGALGAVAVAVRPRWARPYGPLVAGVAVVAALAAVVGVEAGEALEARLGYTGDALELLSEHGRWGLWTRNLTLAFAALAVAASVLQRRTRTAPARVAAALAALVGVAATVFAVLAGDSGAQSVWGFVLQA